MRTLSVLIGLLIVHPMSSSAASHNSSAGSSRIQKLKHEIVRISEKASSKVRYDAEDNDPRVRAKLEPLVAELVRLAPKRTQAEKLLDVVGAWKSVWSDLSFYGPYSPRVESVYQIVFPTGYYYNLSIYDLPEGSVTSVIKGLYTVEEPALGIEFVKTSRSSVLFPAGSDLATLAMRAELGAYDEMVDPLNAPGIGFKSNFEQVYVDHDLRIGRGKVADGSEKLFILRRAKHFERH